MSDVDGRGRPPPDKPARTGLGRSQWLALLGVAVLLVGAFALRGRDGAPPPVTAAAGRTAPQQDAPDLAALRAQADLAPCPTGLGPAFPDLTLPCLGGGAPVPLRAQPPGRPTLVNVWASWCGPCREEVPLLTDLAGRATGAVDVVGVLNTDTQASALAFSRASGIHYPSLVDDDGAVQRAAPAGLPKTLFVAPDGTVVHTKLGAFADAAELDAAVLTYFGVRVPA